MSVGVAYKSSVVDFKDNFAPELLDSEGLAANRKQLDVVSQGNKDDEYLVSILYDLLAEIRDPEHNNTLEELKIISPDSISLSRRFDILVRSGIRSESHQDRVEADGRTLFLRHTNRTRHEVAHRLTEEKAAR